MSANATEVARGADPRMVRAVAAAESYDPEARQWWLLKTILWLYRAVCVRAVHVTGRQHLAAGARILVSNHARVSDSFLLPFIFGRLHGLTQVESFTLPILGKMLARAGQIPIAPGRGREALDRAKALLQRGETILIYPEGRLSHGAELQRGKTGAARLSLESGAPLQPVAVHVPERFSRMIHSYFYGRPTTGAWQFGGAAFIAIGEAWRPFAGVRSASPRDLRHATDEIMGRVGGLLAKAQAAARLR